MKANYRVPEVSLHFLWVSLIGLGLAFMIAACSGGGGSSTGTASGNVSVSLTDAATVEYKAVYVTIKTVEVHITGDTWNVIAAPNKTFNLLELANGVREELGIASLPTGSYTQMRLIIGDTPDQGINILSEIHPYANYVIGQSDEYHELKIPSGFQTGIKIVHGFAINANQTTELILDFDASKSVVKAGNSGKWLLNPTIKVLDTQLYSIVSGKIQDSAGTPLEGVLVSAQTYDPNAADVKDEVLIQTSTISNQDGLYTIFLQPGTYNLVAYANGFHPLCSRLVALPDASHEIDFTLDVASTGAVSGDVVIQGGSDEQYATLSFRQTASCSGDSETIEVMSINVANQAHYSVVLPEGAYGVAASTFGQTTQTHQVDVTADVETTLNIAF